MVQYTQGINRIRDLVDADIHSVEFYVNGSGVSISQDTPPTTAPDYTDTAPTSSTANKTVQITGVLPATSGNGSTFDTAIAFLNSGDSAFLGFQFTDISKTSNKQITVIQTGVLNQA